MAAFIEIQVDPDVGVAKAELRAARKEIKGRVKYGLRKAAEDVALPYVKAEAPFKTGRLKSKLAARARASDAYITVLGGAKMRYAGLLEFGGTIRGPIEPRKKKALRINGEFVGKVSTPRTYAPRAYIRTSLLRHQDAIEDAIETEVRKAFTESGFEG